MIFAQTHRLNLRALRIEELPRLVELFGAWDVVRWLSVVPFPYTLRDATEFYEDIASDNQGPAPQFYALALKTDNLLIGGVGLHPPRTAESVEGDVEMGYWLGKNYWGHGLMKEATRKVVELAFDRPTTEALCATTDPHNNASQKVLRAAGLHHKGLVPRTYEALRGSDEVVSWHLARKNYQVTQAA